MLGDSYAKSIHQQVLYVLVLKHTICHTISWLLHWDWGGGGGSRSIEHILALGPVLQNCSHDMNAVYRSASSANGSPCYCALHCSLKKLQLQFHKIKCLYTKVVHVHGFHRLLYRSEFQN